jgi:uncharacterized repeat protein (TIGR03987 family)
MPPTVKAAVLLMVAALGLYSTGVWATFFARRLKPWAVALFWLGLLADVSGTELMRRLAGGLHWTLHTATGAVALFLMLAHAIWATVVLLQGQETAIRRFHRISVTVWILWLIPFITGLVLGYHRGR